MSTQTTTLTPPDTDRPAPESRAIAEEPSWSRPALLVLLAATAALYLWGLGASGWANSFYAAAAQAGSESWKALFFGASDAASSITVDKTPASLWVMGLSIRMFGLSSWSLLVPQALMGVASVGLLHGTVRRTTGSAVAGLLAGTVLALTPIAVLMFRFDNPDALLVLLMIGSVSCTVRALQSSRLRAEGLAAHPVRWLALAGALVGLAFLTKMLQAFLVLPALGPGLPARGTHDPGPADRAPARRVRHDAARRRLVGGDRRAVAGLLAAVHRRVTAQLDPRADAGLQRLRPAHRRRDRIGRRRPGWPGRPLGRDRDPADVQLRGRRPDRLVAARRARPAGGRPVVHPARATHRPGPRRPRGVG